MRLFFEDPSGERLALDTNAREWAATYETEDTKITDDHFIIEVEDGDTLRRIEREADFCGYGYNNEIDDERRNKRVCSSVYAETLQELTGFYIEVENIGQREDGRTVEEIQEHADELERRFIRQRKEGYFNPRQADALLMILYDIKEGIELYRQAEETYKRAIQEQAEEVEPF